MPDTPAKQETIFKGVAASPGVAHGLAFVLLQKEVEVPIYKIEEEKIPDEIRRFEEAITQTGQEISHLRTEVAERLGEQEAQIFEAHLLVLEDKALIDETIHEMRTSKYNVDYCFHVVAKRFIEAFGNIDDAYIKERVTDIRDVTRRVIHALLGHSPAALGKHEGQRVIVSEDLTPSDTASIGKGGVSAFVTNVGSRTSHAVIMARSLQVPAVVGLHDATQHIDNGDYVLVDGYEGVVIVHPTEHTLYKYGRIQQRQRDIRKRIESSIPLPSQTLDGAQVRLVANISEPSEVKDVLHFGAQGVGLYRTEGLFLGNDRFPTEEEQFHAYRTVVEELKPLPVVIRTLDLGGDKRTNLTHFANDEENPFMGFRAIRFCLEHKDVFREQLRAILRAGAHGNVRIMYPMISGVQELIQANHILDEAKEELRKRGVPYDAQARAGSMIEIPGAAWTADQIATHSAFFSIGTNDLIQYTLAVDRVNDRVAHLYDPAHPAVLRSIRHIITTAHERGLPVSICGEMAGDPLYTPLLLAFGADDLSVAPSGLPDVKYLLRNIRMSEAKALTEEVMAQSDPKITATLLRRFYNEHMGELSDTSPGI